MKQLLELFLSFFKVGALTFGGGYAMLPILQREVVDTRQWISNEELMDIYAVGQCTPGLIAVNTATYIGSVRKGIFGGILATLGFLTPGLLVILVIAGILDSFMEHGIVLNAFAGLQVCVCVLIINACLKLRKNAVTDHFSLIVFLLVLAGDLFFSISPAILVILAGAAGVIYGMFSTRRNRS